MSTKPNTPVNAIARDNGYVECYGLTKREYFAAMAMQGTMSSDINGDWPGCKSQAEYSVKCADALIEALNEENTTDEQPNSI